MIEVTDLSYHAGKMALLSGQNFKVEAGEMLAILGPNGAGKSTLLKLLSRELSPGAGNIQFKGEALHSYNVLELARKRAVLMQHNTVSIAFRVKELVMMGRYPHFELKPGLADEKVVEEVMRDTEITHLSDREYNTLSGGEQQRVQLARVLAQIYDVPGSMLLLDEPTNNLDMLHQQQILEMARRMADRGYAVICILHDINFASRYADKILMLKKGKLMAFGEPLQVVNCDIIHETFNIQVRLMPCEGFKCPLVVPGLARVPA